MKSFWIRVLLLCTFAYWGTGTAKFLHELVEHHGGRDDALAQADDDDGDVAAVLASLNLPASHGSTHDSSSKAPQPVKHDEACFICQQLSVMAAERSAPPALPAPTLELVATLTIPDWHSPVVRFQSVGTARAPPVLLLEVV